MCFQNEFKIVRAVLREIAKLDGITFRADVDEDNKWTDDPEKVLKEITSTKGDHWTCDENRIAVHREDGDRMSFVYFIYGNGNDGKDVVSDYGMSLDPVISKLISDEAIEEILKV